MEAVMIERALQRLLVRENLERSEMAEVVGELADGKVTPAQAGAFLTALRMKGETVEEIAGAAMVMRSRVEAISVAAPVCVDTCGTGGDGLNTFNISTASAFVVAGAGVAVAKHGNRAVSSRCGSADVLAALGIRMDLPKERVQAHIATVGIGFLFAPNHHPALKALGGIRRELGFRTLFNLLGPLANPAGVRHQVMGVYDARWVPVMGRVLATLGARHAMVVHGGGGLDEISLSGPTLVCEVRGDVVEDKSIVPEELGLARAPVEALAGGDVSHNARILRDVLSGQKGAPRDAVLANAGAALRVAGAAETWADGVKRAAEVIDSGAAEKKLAALIEASHE
jgi:anthranilate phosphoribosyltransferase